MSKKRICVLTQPLSNGYGGLLQAYALQTVLKRMGYQVWTEDRKHNSSVLKRIVTYFKYIIIYIFFPLLNRISNVYYSTPNIIRQINKNTDYFKHKYLNTTEPIYSNRKGKLKKYKFDIYIVGSDQVWRPRYSYGKDSIYNYFLDFTVGTSVKRIAYAASFGVADWEFTDIETIKCGTLLQNFDAVSVREDDGVTLCKKFFNVDAMHVLDPTLLLEKEDYISIVNMESVAESNGNLFCYFLDPSQEKSLIADNLAKSKSLKPFSILPKSHYYNVGPQYIKDCIYPSVASWLRAFMDASYVITDSFHGTVFSIIFNKPFIVIANKSRGLSRFTSILKIFGLERRLIYSKEELTAELISEKIDFTRINYIKKEEQKKSLAFLSRALEL